MLYSYLASTSADWTRTIPQFSAYIGVLQVSLAELAQLEMSLR